MTQPVTVGIDIGTSSVKAVAADADGNVVASSRIPHAFSVPAPLQFEHESSNEDNKKWRTELKLAQLPKNERLATKKLSEYYGKLGFRRIARTSYMVRTTEWVLPDIERLV